jgi:OOP family OmpA-OmpF porin
MQRASHEYGYGNYESSDWFADRAIEAASGNAPAPQNPAERVLPADVAQQTAASHERLMAALDGVGDVKGPGRDLAPDAAAKAQVMLECWMEEASEGTFPSHTAFCKDEFFAALNDVETAIAPEEVVMVVEEVEAVEFLVYFDLNEASIRADQQATMDVVIAAAQAAPDRALRIVGHTDTSGAIDYNQALSERRAISVITEMLDAGIDRIRITSEAVGQTQPLVATGDGVVEQANRVAVITLEP